VHLLAHELLFMPSSSATCPRSAAAPSAQPFRSSLPPRTSHDTVREPHDTLQTPARDHTSTKARQARSGEHSEELMVVTARTGVYFAVCTSRASLLGCCQEICPHGHFPVAINASGCYTVTMYSRVTSPCSLGAATTGGDDDEDDSRQGYQEVQAEVIGGWCAGRCGGCAGAQVAPAVGTAVPAPSVERVATVGLEGVTFNTDGKAVLMVVWTFRSRR